MLIENLISLPSENEIVEFKRDNKDKSVIGKKISALANSANLCNEKRAYLVYGISDSEHEVVGTRFFPSKEKIGNIPIEFWLNQHLDPKTEFIIYEKTYQSKPITVFEIYPAVNQPIKFNGIAYIRIGETTPKLSDYPSKERKIWTNISGKNFEKGIAMENVTTLDVLKLLDFEKYSTLTNQEIPTETQQFVEKMCQYDLVRKVFDNSYDITNLGALLFAKNINEFPTIRRKAVRVIKYDGNTKVKITKEVPGTFGYACGFEGLVGYINDQLPTNEYITDSLREERRMYPKIAIREFIANALIHQDLSISGTGPTIEIFDNRIEITNPGEPLIPTDRFIDHPPRSRNEDMASFMRQIGICEEGGTGIDRALTSIDLYQLPPPKFEKFDDFTKVTMYAHKSLKDMTLDDKTRACFQHCVLKYIEKSHMTNASLRKRLNIGERNYPAASRIIAATIKKGLIKEAEKQKEYIPSWA
ncbi:MAG: ATP-binding protein [Candidatus Shapirobacteria bacterium]